MTRALVLVAVVGALLTLALWLLWIEQRRRDDDYDDEDDPALDHLPDLREDEL